MLVLRLYHGEPYTGGQPSPSPEYPQEIEIPGSDKEMRVELKAANLIPLNENEEKTQYGVTFKQNTWTVLLQSMGKTQEKLILFII